MKRRNLLLLGLFLLANFLLLWGQSLVALWKYRDMSAILLPEWRYYVQSLIVLLPVLPLFLLRLRHGRKLLAVLLVALVAHAGGYLVKAQIPGTRRSRHLAACDWAVGTIRADYQGRKSDPEPFFSPDEYHPLKRPVVVAHTDRVAYLLNGRGGEVFARREGSAVPACFFDMEACGVLVDVPDYIVNDAKKINADWWKVADYKKLSERKFGKREFVIYKRIR